MKKRQQLQDGYSELLQNFWAGRFSQADHFYARQIFYICNGFWVIWQILQFYSYVLL